MYDVAKKEHSNVVSTQKAKLEKLNNGLIGQDYEKTSSKLVHNYSSHTLTPSEERLLARGWNFCIEQRITSFIDFKIDLELNALKLEEHCNNTILKIIYLNIHQAAEKMMKQSKNKSIRNLSEDEWKALNELKKNDKIIISRSDKGNAIVILDKSGYITKIEHILNNRQFSRTNKNQSKEKETELNKLLRQLKKEKIIDEKLFWKLHSTSSSTPVLYGQPKLHKTGLPMRPIISTIGAYNYSLSKYLAKIISEHKQPSASYLKDSFELVKTLSKTQPNEKHKICSFDVESLYTNVPVNETIELTLDLIFKQTRSTNIPFDRKTAKKLLELAVCS
ncbi:unnamed protein product, partial [Rotaria sp. Silwood2]